MNFKPGIKIIEEIEGDGAAVKKGNAITIKLNAWLNKGQQIQKDHIELIKLGTRSVIPGIEYSVIGMKVSGIRKVKISPHLAYGEKGVKHQIPPNAILIYEIEILKVM